MRVRRKTMILAFGLLAGALGAASMAWACTFSPRLLSLTPEGGPRATEVTIAGQGAAAPGLVEIRWNGVAGPKIGEAVADASGNFSAVARIPDAAPNVYSLVAVAGNVGIGHAAYEVTGDVPVSLSRGTAGDVPAPSFASPQLSVSDRPQPLSDGGTPILAVGMGFLGTGLVALFAGVLIASVRRRRAPSRLG